MRARDVAGRTVPAQILRVHSGLAHSGSAGHAPGHTGSNPFAQDQCAADSSRLEPMVQAANARHRGGAARLPGRGRIRPGSAAADASGWRALPGQAVIPPLVLRARPSDAWTPEPGSTPAACFRQIAAAPFGRCGVHAQNPVGRRPSGPDPGWQTVRRSRKHWPCDFRRQLSSAPGSGCRYWLH